MNLYLLIGLHLLSCFWIKINYLDDTSNISQTYIETIYAITTTATTIGYGDFLISHSEVRNVNGRFLYQLFNMLNGIMFSSIIFSLVNKLMKGFSYISDKEAIEV